MHSPTSGAEESISPSGRLREASRLIGRAAAKCGKAVG